MFYTVCLAFWRRCLALEVGSRAVSRCSAGRVGAGGRFSTGYVEVSELTLITKMEGVWDHLELGSGLGWECDGLTWYDDENV